MKTTHTKQNKESIKTKLEDRGKITSTKRVSIRTTIVTNTILAIIIASTPYLFQLYEYAPEDTQVWKTIWFTFEDTNYIDIRTAFWVYMNKFIPLLLMVIWFFTCNKWWYHVILIPMFMFGFQLFSAINDKETILDVVEIYWLIPIMMVIIPIVYLIRLKLIDKLIHGIDLKKIEAELEEYEQKENKSKSIS